MTVRRTRRRRISDQDPAPGVEDHNGVSGVRPKHFPLSFTSNLLV